MIDLAAVATTIQVRPCVLEVMLAHAREAGTHECCGALLGRLHSDVRLVERAVPLPNVAADPSHAYLIEARTVRRVEREARATGLGIVGYYHSHPGGRGQPSAIDLDSAWPWLSYLIIGGADEQHVTAWRLRTDRSGFDPEELEWVG